MKNKFIIGGVIVIAFVVSLFFAVQNISMIFSVFRGGKETLMIGNDVFIVDVADSESLREKGLSGRLSLAKNEGMLFRYDTPVIPVFWMKGMNFPIDIVWVSEGKVVGWVSDVDPQKGAPESGLRRYSPAGYIDSAVEIPSGSVTRLNIAVGENVILKK